MIGRGAIGRRAIGRAARGGPRDAMPPRVAALRTTPTVGHPKQVVPSLWLGPGVPGGGDTDGHGTPRAAIRRGMGRGAGR